MELVQTIPVGRPVLKLRWRPGGGEVLCVTTSADADELSLWEVGPSSPARLVSRETFSFPPRRRPFDPAREARGRVGDCAFHPSGDWFALARRRQPLETRRTADLSVLQHLPAPHAEDSLCFLNGGAALAHSSARRGPDELAPGAPYTRPTTIRSLEPARVVGELWESDTAVALHPDGRLLAAAWNEQGDNVLWFAVVEGHAPPKGVRTALRHYLGFGGLVFSPDGELLATVPLLGSAGLVVYALPSLGEVFSVEEPVISKDAFQPSPDRVVFSPDSSRLVYGSASGALVEVEARTGVRTREWPAHRDLATTLDLDPSSGGLASGGLDGEIHIWQTDYEPPPPTSSADLSRITQAFIDQAGLVDPSHWEPFF
jgi:WD40 repeat protein